MVYYANRNGGNQMTTLRPTCFRCSDRVTPTDHTHNGQPVGAPCHRCGRLTTTVSK